MRRRARSLVPVAATFVVAGCAVTFGPADYTGGSADLVADAKTSEGVGDEPDSSTERRPVSRHLLVIAGERDGSSVTTNDVWVAPIDERGDVGEFEIRQPAFFRGALVTANVAAGRLFVVSRASGRSVEHVEFDAGVGAGWEGQVLDAPTLPGYGQIFAGSSLLSFGGGGYVEADGGGTERVYDDMVRVNEFDGTSFGVMDASATRLPVGLRDMGTIAYGDFVYIVGGDGEASDQGSKVYVARFDRAAGVGPFTETAPLVNPQTNRPHAPTSPILCAGDGMLFVLGGSGSDVVLFSTINGDDGSLGPFRSATKLPGPLRGAGCAIWDHTIHLVGGVGASRSDRIVRARIEGGTLGEWELSSGSKLPEPRSNVIALTY